MSKGLKGHTSFVMAVALSQDGKMALRVRIRAYPVLLGQVVHGVLDSVRGDDGLVVALGVVACCVEHNVRIDLELTLETRKVGLAG